MINNNLIYDIGFNDGADTAFYLYRNYNVVAVDADPLLIEAGQKRFAKEISEGRFVLLNNGIAPERGTLKFFVNTVNSEWSSFIEGLGSRRDPNYYSIQVECITLADLMQKYGVPYYMKIDIEGYDDLVLPSLMQVDCKPKYISVEASNPKCLTHLIDIGYNKFKLISQGKITKQKNKDWIFTEGSSGNFAEQTPSRWLSAKTLLQKFSKLPKNDWFDIHAKIIK